MKFVKFRSAIAIALMSAMLPVTMISCDKDDDNDNLRSKEYPLAAVGNSGVTGKVTFKENTDKSFNVIVSVTKSQKDTVHLLNILNGTVANPGPVALNLANITGTGAAATSETKNVKQIKLADNSMKNVTYDSILKFTGHVKMVFSATKSDSTLASGNIGTN